ncbi:hypothetical protein KY290_031300 [Solanum tuberosum]|uniref:DUF3444 domain-containing protein n=1 Tax=Solanum tuberosum TaxID=4113 RepID=A0ABQ7U8S3_SOLTU|nr:hypothetical protein KY290_031300 [Solanum tuberosum]
MHCNKEEATKARGIAEEMMEKVDVPEGSFELDHASIPTYHLGVSTSSIYQRATTNFIDFVNSPEPEFYKFADERSPEKFQTGQYWAIYINEDSLPRYYGKIKKIDLLPEFVLHVAWFYACPLPKSTIRWHDKTMPIGCGLFKFRNSKLNKYTVINNFSHVVAAIPLKMGVSKIFPRTGEVCAVYKNWSAQLMKVDASDDYIDVKFLALVKGFKSVYMARVEEKRLTK